MAYQRCRQPPEFLVMLTQTGKRRIISKHACEDKIILAPRPELRQTLPNAHLIVCLIFFSGEPIKQIQRGFLVITIQMVYHEKNTFAVKLF
jgi:hypothetical protein